MANVFWLGASTVVREVRTLTVVAGGTSYTVTVNGSAVVYVPIGGDTATTIATAIASLITSRGSVLSQYSEISAVAVAAVVTLTGLDDGAAFSLTGSSAGGGSLTAALVTTGVSPNDVALVGNYSTGALPADNDTLLCGVGAGDMRYNLDALQALTLNITRDAGGPKLGLAPARSNGLREWRPQRMKCVLAAFACRISSSEPSYSVRVDAMGGTPVVNATGGGTGSVAQLELVNVVATSRVNASNIGLLLCSDPAFTDVISFLNCFNCVAQLGLFGSVGAAGFFAGSVKTVASFTSMVVDADAVVVVDGAATGTPTIDGGRLIWNSSAAIVNPVLGSDGVLDLSAGTPPVAITGALTVTGDTRTVSDPNQRLVRPFAVVLNRTQLSGTDFVFGTHYRMTIADV